MDSALMKRTLSPRLADVVAELELRQAQTVSIEDVAKYLGTDPASSATRRIIGRLIAQRWLAPLPTRGRYEFLPASGGPFSRNDPLAGLRAAIARRPDLQAQIGLSAAAFLRSIADRAPRRYQVLVAAAQPLSAAFAREYEVHRVAPVRLFGAEPIREAPVSTAERLVVEAALWPDRVGDLRAAEHWVGEAVRRVEQGRLLAMLSALASDRTTARAGYFAKVFGRPDLAREIRRLGRSPVAVPLSPSTRTGCDTPRDAEFNVLDNVGVASRR